jgi:hypothetical protein
LDDWKIFCGSWSSMRHRNVYFLWRIWPHVPQKGDISLAPCAIEILRIGQTIILCGPHQISVAHEELVRHRNIKFGSA